MRAREDVDPQPVGFVRAVELVRDAPVRPEISRETMPAPQRIAPHAFAVSGDVTVRGDELGTGRLVLLHDPVGNDAWDGTFRIVTFARAEIEPEMGADPLLPAVGWSWLTDALAANDAEYLAPSGSVTAVRTEGFGGLAEDGSDAHIEIRASWTPADADEVARHVTAWGDLLCTVAGLPPAEPGVLPLPGRSDGLRGRSRR